MQRKMYFRLKIAIYNLIIDACIIEISSRKWRIIYKLTCARLSIVIISYLS